METSICAVIVTYNRLLLLQKCISHLRQQTHVLDAIIVVNNGSTDNTASWLNDQKDLIVFHQENLGGAGGFHRGIKEAYERKFDWIWVMDDDAFAESKAVEELFQSIRHHNFNQDFCFWSNPGHDQQFSASEKVILDEHVMFVGFAISSKAVRTIGLPRADFFIFRDDSEFTYRLLKHQFTIIKLRDSIIEHRSYYENEFYSKKILGLDISFHKMSNMKLFYYFRNHLLMYPLFSYKWAKALIFSLYEFTKIILLSKEQIKIASIAILHGILRKSGIYHF